MLQAGGTSDSVCFGRIHFVWILNWRFLVFCFPYQRRSWRHYKLPMQPRRQARAWLQSPPLHFSKVLATRNRFGFKRGRPPANRAIGENGSDLICFSKLNGDVEDGLTGQKWTVTASRSSQTMLKKRLAPLADHKKGSNLKRRGG